VRNEVRAEPAEKTPHRVAEKVAENAAAAADAAGNGPRRGLARLKTSWPCAGRARWSDEEMADGGPDLENYRKRVIKEMDQDRRYAAFRWARDLLPTLDNLHRALDAPATVRRQPARRRACRWSPDS